MSYPPSTPSLFLSSLNNTARFFPLFPSPPLPHRGLSRLCMMRRTPHVSVCVLTCYRSFFVCCFIFSLLAFVGSLSRSLALACAFSFVGLFAFPYSEEAHSFHLHRSKSERGGGGEGRTYAHALSHTHARTREERDREIDPFLRRRTRIPSHLCAWRARRHEASTPVTGTLSFLIFPTQ